MKRKFFSALLLMTLSVASVGMFVSCKDYDDDINGVRDDVTNLRNELNDARTTLTDALNAAQTDLQTQINDAKLQLQNAIDSKADQATVTALEARVTTLEGDLAALKSTYEEKIKLVDEALANYGTDIESIKKTLATLTAVDGDIAKLKERIAALEGKVSDLESLNIAEIAKEAVAKDLEAQAAALQAFKDEIAKADYQGQIDKLKEQLNNLPSSEDLKNMKDMLEKYDLKTLDANIQKALSEIANLQSELANYATKEDLSDLQTFLEGKLTALSDEINTTINENVNSLTVFVEKLLSSISLVPDLYVGGIEAIEFKVLNYTPVAPGTSGLTPLTGAKAIMVDNGLTTATYRLNPSAVQLDNIDQANIDYVAATAQVRSVLEKSPVAFNGIESFKNGLMTVKLKKTNTESLDLGENQTYIVALKVPRYNKDGSTTDIYSENSRLVQTDFSPKIAKLEWDATDDLHHYADSASVWAAQVDNDTKYVVKNINYNETFDLSTIVTGCFMDDKTHSQITKEELKKYGLAFRFAIPTKPYTTAADHNTDQQQFASVTEYGVISSKLPNGETDNRAVIGKEPIVRVMLCDTVHNQLVDERYMKVKWSYKELEDVVLDNRTDETTLSCDEMTASLDWKWVVQQIYAKVSASGMSQETFETVYPSKDITTELVGDNKYTTGADNMPIFKSTTNDKGDAIIATWTLAPEDVAKIYPEDSKTFTVKVTFKSSLPEEYPDLVMNWNFTINLPKLPTLNGYYQNYWYDPYNSHDVMAIQYGSKAAEGKAMVEFRNNLMNAFTYKDDNSFIVNGIPECGSWDIQFSADQSVSGFKPNYTGTEPLTTEGVDVANFGAYKLMNGTDQALRFAWNTGHKSWDNDIDYREASLIAAPNNKANWALMNPLSQENEVDGRTPKRTHDKKVNISIWAKLNQWNVVPVKKYTVCLVAPLRVNANLAGHFEEGLVSGSSISCAKAFTMTDFRGYTVAKEASTSDNEFEKYADKLYTWYDVQDPTFDLTAVRYGMKVEGGSVVVDDNLEYKDCMTAAQIQQVTNGNIKLSITKSGDNLVFKNNGGSNVEKECNVFIPATTRYAFGEITEYIKVRLYPRGQVPATAKRR